jgi:hypothetical protein
MEIGFFLGSGMEENIAQAYFGTRLMNFAMGG